MDILVDATLDDTNANLRAIHDEFENAKETMDGERDIWGQDDVREAMIEFVENWRVHREKMLKGIKSLGDKVDEGCQTWPEVDKQLTEILSPDGGGSA